MVRKVVLPFASSFFCHRSLLPLPTEKGSFQKHHLIFAPIYMRYFAQKRSNLLFYYIQRPRDLHQSVGLVILFR